MTIAGWITLGICVIFLLVMLLNLNHQSKNINTTKPKALYNDKEAQIEEPMFQDPCIYKDIVFEKKRKYNRKKQTSKRQAEAKE